MAKTYLFIKDLDSLKLKVKKHNPLYIRLLEQCKRYEDVILSDKHPKGSSSYMGMAAANLSLLSLLSHDPRWIDEAKRWIFTALSYDHWGHTNLVHADINSSWVLFGLSLSYNWFNEFLTETEREYYKKRVYIQANKKWTYKEKHSKTGWPVRYWQNHNWLNFTGLATAAYALMDDYPIDSRVWLKGAEENFKKIFSLLPDDGSDYEGVVYWRYGIIWLLQYAELVKLEEGIDIFKNSKFLRNTFYYRLYQCSPIFEKNYNFGDCHDTRSGHSSAVYFKLASEYNITEAQWMGEHVLNNLLYKEAFESSVQPGILPEAFLEMLWYNPEIKKRNPKNMPTTRFFPDLGLLSCRSGWGPDAFAFSVKAGFPGGKRQWEKSWGLQKIEGFTRRSLCHQHPDDGSPILWKGANNYIIDDGYNREVKASDHNMILFDGKGYNNEGRHNIFKKIEKDQHAFIEKIKIEDKFTYFCANLKNVYDRSLGVTHFKRHFFYTGANSLLIFDELLSESSKTITWQIHSEEHLSFNNGYFSSMDQNFRLTSIIEHDYHITTETKVISAILNKQDPDRKTRRKMVNLGLHIENNYKMNHFLTLIQTGGGEYIKPHFLENEKWRGFYTERVDQKQYYFFSKIGNKKLGKLPDIDIKSSSNFVYIAVKDGIIDVEFHS
ncbi:DUF4962 domain-containing protein [Thiospirochaeta perfilievii]|uniref:DUF4962 domain-containing protein n=1 Tax=Thiospirochaeta perfilievii TaxID=252967 RepID=A0A5C1QCN8_9SPIO|nr:DUF4962 domain-containing protein [Thiospirochaeta perfilievii]QEN05098.1 DUF4962 domain-containing protein [Thiospirochaeta perfilievii]